MLVFREAHKKDAQSIANLHAINWQENYRGVFSDHYLDNEVVSDRLSVWKTRFSNPSKNQHIVLVEEEGELLGFCCAYFNEDSLYGTYLDNLHVSAKAKGKGLGTRLIGRLVNDIISRNYNGFYLWVLEKNDSAIKFYDNLNGEQLDRVEASDIGDAKFIKVRYVWKDLKELQSLINLKFKEHEC